MAIGSTDSLIAPHGMVFYGTSKFVATIAAAGLHGAVYLRMFFEIDRRFISDDGFVADDFITAAIFRSA